MVFIPTENICSPATGRFFHPTSFTSESSGRFCRTRTFFSFLLILCFVLAEHLAGTTNGNMILSGPMHIKRAGSPQLFRFLKRGAEGSLIHPEPARSVLQRSPPIRRRELEPSDFRPRFKRCRRQKKQKKNCLSDKTATASDRFLVSRVSSAGLAMRQFLLSRGKKETRDGS